MVSNASWDELVGDGAYRQKIEVLDEFLAEGAAGLVFESRGRHRLKGLEREHELFAASSSTG